MRLPTALLLALAAPAQAQQADTGRTDIGIDDYGAQQCRFTGLPELGIHGDVAGWRRASIEEPEAFLRLAFLRSADPLAPVTLRIVFEIAPSPGVTTDTVASVRLSIDGVASDTPIPTSAASARFTLAVPTPHVAATGARLALSRTVGLDLYDAAGTRLRGFTWDTRRLAEIPALLAQVQWRCTAP